MITCSSCQRLLPDDHFRVRITLPALEGRKARPDGTRYTRTDWGKIVVKPDAPCRACRARAAVRATYEKRKREAEEKRQADIADCLKHGREVPPELLPKVRLVTGTDPVVLTLSKAIAVTRQQLRTVEQGDSRQGVVSGAGGEEGVVAPGAQEHPFVRWRRRLLEARVVLFDDARNRRKIDLQTPLVAADPLKMSVRAYISNDDIRTLDWIADKVNYFAPIKRGRRWAGMPRLRAAASDRLAAKDGSNLTQADVLVGKAWEPYLYAINAAKRSSTALVRRRQLHGPKRAHEYTATLDDGSVLRFTMEDYHLKRVEAARAASRQIEDALSARTHPGDWEEPWSGNVPALRDWGALVPPEIYNDLRAMWRVLPEDKQQKLRPFRMRVRLDPKLATFQRAQGLAPGNVRPSEMLAVEAERPALPRPKKGAHKFLTKDDLERARE